MQYSELIKAEAWPILEAQLAHPFVTGLGDGTLSLDKFSYYMIQDAIYIVDYARALAWVAPLLPDVRETMRMLETAKMTFEVESMLKETYFEQFGISTADALGTDPAPTCRAYIDHLFRWVRNGTLAEGMAAVLPCGWIYVEIGEKLTRNREIPENHPYRSWLMTYAVPEFRDMVDWWFGILDHAVRDLPGTVRDHIRDIFLTSCRYEWMFWDMAWNLESWKP